MTHTDIDAGALANVQYRQIGKPLTRTDAPGKVTGRTPYAGDYVMPNMLHMRVLRADIASARLVRLDVSKARALKGVARVLTAADLADRTAGHRHPRPNGPEEAGYGSAGSGEGAGPLFRRATGVDCCRNPRSRRPGGGPDRVRA